MLGAAAATASAGLVALSALVATYALSLAAAALSDAVQSATRCAISASSIIGIIFFSRSTGIGSTGGKVTVVVFLLLASVELDASLRARIARIARCAGERDAGSLYS
ncbi:hypothetical protein BC828DRAFT_394013 [Blastocladiella britannica]|nr:hypothetical protein BC828DRAFT_394013 [Blastocladiella britannica]